MTIYRPAVKAIKDNFSTQSDFYLKYRPQYPAEFIQAIIAHTVDQKLAWDCATGNGQVAIQLSAYFEKVIATDISSSQLAQVLPKHNINYQIGRAEEERFPAYSFDLVTVGQAIHWFDFNAFYQQVKRVLKPSGIFAAFGYGLITITPAVDLRLQHFYTHIVGHYWDEERKLVDEAYQTIPFPFTEIQLPNFSIDASWTLADLKGYLSTWSSVKKYIQLHQHNPVDSFITDLQVDWPDNEAKPIRFPLFQRIGKVA